MPPELTQLDHPIDVMYLIHKAIRAEARYTRQAAEQLEMGGNFKSFMQVFYQWAMALGYHEETEYKYLIPYIPKSPPTQHNEVGHKELLEGLEDLQVCLHEELGRTIVIPRTQRQLFGKVITLLIAQADLLEEEEETVLPLVRQWVSEEQQLEMARRLLFDSESEDERWMLNWVAQHLTDTERQVLADFVDRFDETADLISQPSTETVVTEHTAPASTVEPEIVIPMDQLAFDHPIDVMMHIHKALSIDAWRAERIVEGLEIGEDLQVFRDAFNSWIKALGFHADMEDTYMTPLLPESTQARDNEAAHVRLGQRVEEIQTYLQEIGTQAATPRIRRRLFGKVVALRIDQDDHLEEEEEFVLPIIRDRMSTKQQLEIATHLLLDPTAPAEEWAWVIDWMTQDLTDVERRSISNLTERFDKMNPQIA